MSDSPLTEAQKASVALLIVGYVRNEATIGADIGPTGKAASAKRTGLRYGHGVPSTEDVGSTHRITLTVNGVMHECLAQGRTTLADLLRDTLGLTGVKLGCEHGVCGCCTVLLDGDPVRSCLILAPTVDGSDITTIEGLAAADGSLSPIQQAFADAHALQCGYCTPGMILAAHALLRDNPHPSEVDVADALGGNLCRCTGYQQIREAVGLAAETGGTAEAAGDRA